MENEELVYLVQQGINVNENMQLLYEQNERFIKKIANKYANYQEREDLMQEGYLGLYEACQKYQFDQGTQFITYAAYWIRQMIGRYIKTNGKVIRIPEHLQNKIHDLKRYIDTYNMVFGEKPSDWKLCKYLKVSPNILRAIEKTMRDYENVQSLDTPLNEDEDIFLCDSVPGSDNIEDDVIENIISEDVKKELWEIVKEHTSDNENTVLIGKYQRGKKLKEIGTGINVTGERVRQIEKSALRKLRKPECIRRIKKFCDYDMAYKGSLSSFRYTWTSATERAAIRNLEGYETAGYNSLII